MLVKYGADPNAVDSEGQPIYMQALQNRQDSIIAAIAGGIRAVPRRENLIRYMNGKLTLPMCPIVPKKASEVICKIVFSIENLCSCCFEKIRPVVRTPYTQMPFPPPTVSQLIWNVAVEIRGEGPFFFQCLEQKPEGIPLEDFLDGVNGIHISIAEVQTRLTPTSQALVRSYLEQMQSHHQTVRLLNLLIHELGEFEMEIPLHDPQVYRDKLNALKAQIGNVLPLLRPNSLPHISLQNIDRDIDGYRAGRQEPDVTALTNNCEQILEQLNALKRRLVREALEYFQKANALWELDVEFERQMSPLFTSEAAFFQAQ